MVAHQGDLGVGHALRADGAQPGETDGPFRGPSLHLRVRRLIDAFNGPFGKIVAGLIAEGQSEPAVLQEFFGRWVSPRRNATIADLQRGKNAGELRSDTEPELLNDAIFGAIYYRLLLRSGPLTKRFGEELVEQIIRGHRSGNARS